jgi:PPK2 family polyphosphate:nucleotide phosphotransferase
MLVKPGKKIDLKEIDPADTGRFNSADETEALLQKQLEEISKLQNLLYAESRRAVLIILQGMDTSGKDGTIRHVMSGLSPLGVQVTAFKAPTDEELGHDFLWRVHRAVPRQGYIGIFNRSHYEDVLVVRVHDLVPKKVWKQRYEQINEFEKTLVRNNVVILKFFLHISKGEQRERLRQRLDDPARYWKFSLKDVEERKLWSSYRKAYEAVLERCSTKWAPWHIIPADHKWYRNLLVAESIVKAMRALDMKYPSPTIDLSKIKVD